MKATHRIRDYAGRRIHLIGIGGSSMSGLAEMLMDQGYQVSGSDRDEGYLIHHVREKGGKVMIGHRSIGQRTSTAQILSFIPQPFLRTIRNVRKRKGWEFLLLNAQNCLAS